MSAVGDTVTSPQGRPADPKRETLRTPGPDRFSSQNVPACPQGDRLGDSCPCGMNRRLCVMTGIAVPEAANNHSPSPDVPGTCVARTR